MHGDAHDQYLEALRVEITSLIQQRTWKYVPHQNASLAINSKWVFKLKRLPDGNPSKYKAMFCVRGDIQKEGVEFFEKYAPFCQWSAIMVILTMVLWEEWATQQVDYRNDCAESEINKTVFIEPPKMFGPKSENDPVLLLLKSLYGLKQNSMKISEMDYCNEDLHNLRLSLDYS
jgi:hypothetical protein